MLKGTPTIAVLMAAFVCSNFVAAVLLSWMPKRTGKWIVDRGLLDADAAAGAPSELPADEIERITQQSPSPLGLIRHLAPVARMSATPPRWARPPVPLGHDAPAWPPR